MESLIRIYHNLYIIPLHLKRHNNYEKRRLKIVGKLISTQVDLQNWNKEIKLSHLCPQSHAENDSCVACLEEEIQYLINIQRKHEIQIPEIRLTQEIMLQKETKEVKPTPEGDIYSLPEKRDDECVVCPILEECPNKSRTSNPRNEIWGY